MSDLFWLTDAQMARLEPYFPKSHGKPRVDDRRVLSGIIFINRNGLHSGRASEELHSLIDTVVVDWDAEARVHRLELRGKLLELLETTKPAGAAGLAGCEGSLKLVAGAGFGLWRTEVAVTRR